MESFISKDDVGFDIAKAKKASVVYSKSIGVATTVIDSKGNTLFNTCDEKHFCTICNNTNKGHSCPNVKLYGSYQAERFGGQYVFFCPMGLTYWASPITKDGVMRGAILGGPVLMVSPEDFLLDEFIKSNNATNENFDKLMETIKEIQVIQPDVVNNMSEMLYIVTSHISADEVYTSYIENKESSDQQSDISEYIHFIKTMGGDDREIESYPLEKEKELLSLISLGDKPGSQKVLNEIFGHIFFSTGGNFDVIKARVLELVVLLSRAALEGGADVEQIFGLNYKYLAQINLFNSIEDMTLWLSKIMARFTDCVFNLADVKHVDVIYKAIDYVKRNYMRKVTLEEVASHVYLSPSYFSKVFKDEMKYNFNTYLNNIRIDMSKKLLLDEEVSLVDISSLVGYEDQSYFSKVFKKLTGVSPGRYRESRGQVRPN